MLQSQWGRHEHQRFFSETVCYTFAPHHTLFVAVLYAGWQHRFLDDFVKFTMQEACDLHGLNTMLKASSLRTCIQLVA